MIENRVVIIPARGGSKGIPGKNLRQVGGESLVARAVFTALRASDNVFVSTDDPDITVEARKSGAKIIDRPSEIATDDSSSESAVIHALSQIPHLSSTVVAFLQPTSPFIAAEDLERAFELVESGQCDVAFSATPKHKFAWKYGGDTWEPVGHPHNYRPRRQDLPEMVFETGAFYVFRAEAFLSSQYRFHGNVKPVLVDPALAIDIDEEADLAEANAIHLDRKKWVDGSIDWKRIELIVYDFDGVHTDNTVWVDEDGKESVRVSRSDGMAVAMIRELGVEQLILSTEKNPVVAARAKKLNVQFEQCVTDKELALREYLNKMGLDSKNVVFVGNDINDLPASKVTRNFVAVADASEKVLGVAAVVLSSNGGAGAIREIAELIRMSKSNLKE